ncbi:lectin-like domain-containing protein [Empedobacter brevis]|uniref:lectin-like domain-containing protein n=1 Tax=Empedobacter brevis TaxID=247 RepID=UPI0039B0E420
MKKYFIIYFFFLLGNILFGQFIIKESFKSNKVSSNIILGGVATLTAGKSDPDGDGWLRLTPDSMSQKGYAFINEDFPSALGIIAEFEFKAWRSSQNTSYTGGDGFSVFLFDGSISPTNFRLGGYGGSLGYTRNTATTPPVPNGLYGGYIGIGFDSFGNFGNAKEGKNGLISKSSDPIPKDPNVGDGTIPNTIVLRGATNEETATSSNLILDYAKLGDRSVNAATMRLIGELDYDVLTPTRPTDNQFFRKVKIVILPITKPNNSMSYQIKIYMSNTLNSDYSSIPLIDYTTTQPIPSKLKIGFAASTGGGYNNHEIRNLQITSIGNLSVFNSVDTPLVCNEKQIQDVIFRVDVNNINGAKLNSIQVDSNFLDKIGGSLIDTNFFSITDITYSNNITNPQIQNHGNHFNGTIGLPADSSGSIYIKGTIKKPNTQVVNTVNVSSNEILDPDESNNTSTDIVKRYQCEIVTNPMLYIKTK